MELDSRAKRIWIETQKKFDIPVNAIGIRIKPTDRQTFEIWKREQIDQYVKKKVL